MDKEKLDEKLEGSLEEDTSNDGSLGDEKENNLNESISNEDGGFLKPNTDAIEGVVEPIQEPDLVEDEEKNQKREDLGAKFQSKIERKQEDLDADEDVRDFISQKDVVYEPVDEDKTFEPVKPSGRTSYFWTIALVVLIMTSLTLIVFLVMTGRGSGSGEISKQEQLIVYNNVKSSFDTIFVEATNKLIEAENNFNLEDFVEANDTAKEAEDDFDEALDYLYDLRTVKVDEEMSFLLEYYDTLEDVSDLGEKMANTLAFMARSADRSEYKDASDSKVKYQGYANDMDDLMGDLEKIKKQNKDFFGDN